MPHYAYGSHVSYLFLPSPYASLLFSFKYLVYNQTQADIFLTDHAELNPKIIRRIVNMGIKGYSQLVDIVNFCGKQHNISLGVSKVRFTIQEIKIPKALK